ncbi:MAG: MCE family protein [Acidimicrobiales bacterium]
MARILMAGRRRFSTALLLLALAAPSCSLVGGSGGGGYHVTAYFEEAVSLYPRSPVRIMGMIAGKVDAVTIDGAQVRVDMTINDNVPLPAHVGATISALTLIGERTVLLSPPWKPGDGKVSDGYVIPVENTVTPVEPDEGLKAFVELVNAIEPKVVNQIITGGAAAFSGHEQEFNDLLNTTSDLWSTLGSQDDRLIEAANSIHVLASQLNQRDQQLNSLFEGFAETSQMLADQRDAIASVLDGSLRVVDAGASLLDTYGPMLTADLATFAQLGAVLENNTAALTQIFDRLAPIAQGIANAYDPEGQTFRLGVNISPTLAGILDGSLGRILRQLGLCPPNGGGIC